MIETEILVAGGGIAGMSAAARLASLGREVTLVDPAPAGGGTPDLRTTAFLQPAIETLEHSGAWAGMAGDAAPLKTMRLVDAGGRERVVRKTADFNSAEVIDRPFGFNVANAAIRAALTARLDEAGVRYLHQVAVFGTVERTQTRIARLSDGRQVSARLVIAADGRDSALRQMAGLTARRWHYGQKALVFAVGHDAPHEGVSTEIHRTGGPLTLVPMPDEGGRPRSSVVWMVPGPKAARLAQLGPEALGAELTAETMDLFGALDVLGPHAVWPIIGQLATRLTAPRLALIAEAAHVIPPIGAQGLNMSLKDVETLAHLIGAAEDPGSAQILSPYQARRWPDMAARVAGVDVLNRAAQAEWQPLRDLRHLGLSAIHDIPPIRRLAMKLGLGA
ncbi:MAG: FAD-dependent oxidoreductase [Pseudomonadota bacterium]